MYSVVLHNDDSNTVTYVTKTLTRVFDDMTLQEAAKHTAWAHHFHRSLLRTATQEQAEDYCTSLRLHGLASSLEPQ